MIKDYTISEASPEDAFSLTQVAKSSKQYWGYPDEWMALWDEDLTIKPEHFGPIRFWKVCAHDEIAGFASILKEGEVFEIEHCFVAPAHIGKGLGNQLLSYLLSLPEYINEPFQVLADPNAVPFYEKFGFKTVRQVPSKPSGRTLPLMQRQPPPVKQ